jgi:protein-disulfide isomerase
MPARMRQAEFALPAAIVCAKRRAIFHKSAFGNPQELPLALAALRRLAGAALVCAAFVGSAAAATTAPQPDGTADMAKLLQPGGVADLAMGEANAPVTIVEYGSLTCPHCAVFAKDTFPKLKAQYIDSGKVRFVFREFSRNTLDVAGFLLARCLGDDKAYAADELMFATQDKWTASDRQLDALIVSLRAAGMTQEKAQECLKNQTLANAIVAIPKRANDEIKMTGTPTFVINGKVYGGELTFDQLQAVIDPLLTAK